MINKGLLGRNRLYNYYKIHSLSGICSKTSGIRIQSTFSSDNSLVSHHAEQKRFSGLLLNLILRQLQLPAFVLISLLA
ncbi:hypothetical protein [Enterococcus florum]|uniref:hypothetical protein n=1 Tax=Enterococcus florum TaxID=2480627 RepID=UPI0011BA64A4|nr:hypothetical protein [Enterococcus florum]